MKKRTWTKRSLSTLLTLSLLLSLLPGFTVPAEAAVQYLTSVDPSKGDPTMNLQGVYHVTGTVEVRGTTAANGAAINGNTVIYLEPGSTLRVYGGDVRPVQMRTSSGSTPRPLSAGTTCRSAAKRAFTSRRASR